LLKKAQFLPLNVKVPLPELVAVSEWALVAVKVAVWVAVVAVARGWALVRDAEHASPLKQAPGKAILLLQRLGGNQKHNQSFV
jgi:hypothetical protein